MKENNQKIQKKIWGIIIAVLSVCIIATAFFDYVKHQSGRKNPRFWTKYWSLREYQKSI